jgi:hypothetical protein
VELNRAAPRLVDQGIVPAVSRTSTARSEITPSATSTPPARSTSAWMTSGVIGSPTRRSARRRVPSPGSNGLAPSSSSSMIITVARESAVSAHSPLSVRT